MKNDLYKSDSNTRMFVLYIYITSSYFIFVDPF